MDGTQEQQNHSQAEVNKEETPPISFILTGFGRFGNVTENPTSIIIQELESRQLANVDLLKIIETSASGVKNEIDSITECLTSMVVEDEPCQPKHVVLVHFGVNHMKGKGSFAVEQHSYNEATFRIADQGGYQPKKEPIDPSHPLGHKLSTDLNARRIMLHLQKKGFDVGVSGDAGRFVCNYIYFSSLNRMAQIKDDLQGIETHVVFIHVPSFEAIPEETQVQFTIELLDSITEAIRAKDKKKKKAERLNSRPISN